LNEKNDKKTQTLAQLCILDSRLPFLHNSIHSHNEPLDENLLAFVFASGIAIPIYWKYRFKHAEKEEKQLMISQKKINHYYYDRWYTPADSTEIDYQIERIKKRKNQLGKF